MTNLDKWLDAATRGLSEESAARVRAEISDHYQLAYEAAIANGASAEQANLAVIAALGDAKSENREYRRVFLTVWEQRLLDSMRNKFPGLPPGRVKLGKTLAAILMIEAFGMIATGIYKDPSRASTLFFLAPMIAIPLIARVLPISTPGQGRMFRVAQWSFLLIGAFLAATFGAKYATGFVGVFLMTAYFQRTYASIRRKVPVSQWPKQLYYR